MRKKNTQTIGEVIEELIDSLKIKRKLKEVNITESWEELLGKTIASRTTKIYIENNNLYVHLNSSVARNELFMMKDEIINILNKRAGEKIIKNIIFR